MSEKLLYYLYKDKQTHKILVLLIFFFVAFFVLYWHPAANIKLFNYSISKSYFTILSASAIILSFLTILARFLGILFLYYKGFKILYRIGFINTQSITNFIDKMQESLGFDIDQSSQTEKLNYNPVLISNQDNSNVKSILKDMIGSGEFEQVFIHLKNHLLKVKNYDYLNQLTLLKSQYSTIKIQENIKSISYDNASLEKARIINAIIQLIDNTFQETQPRF